MNSLSIFRFTRRLPRFARSYASKGESPWYIDNKPGPCPKTEEEMCAAAKKYEMLREEYEPYPDDGNGIGDYPKIDPVNVEDKNIYHPWSDTLHRRDYREPITVDFAFYTHGRLSGRRERFSPAYMITCFCLAVGAIAALLLTPQIVDYRYHHPTMEKQYPKPGVTHYTFEFANEASGLKH